MDRTKDNSVAAVLAAAVLAATVLTAAVFADDGLKPYHFLREIC